MQVDIVFIVVTVEIIAKNKYMKKHKMAKKMNRNNSMANGDATHSYKDESGVWKRSYKIPKKFSFK